MIADLIKKSVAGVDLTSEEANAAMSEIMAGEASPVQISAFLVAMRMKGETTTEVTEFARVMRQHVRTVKPTRRPLVDTCGTGGDAVKTFNVSTAAAFVAAGAGVAIAKHGNRSVTSKCGSADVLEALGIRFDLTPEEAAKCVDEIGLGFMFAPSYHPAMKHAMPIRRELALRTVFNMLGPLTNPAGAEAQVLGVYAPELTELHAGVLQNLGSSRAFVVHGEGGVDELSIFGATRVSELRDGEVRTYDVTPEDFDLPRAAGPHEVEGNSPEDNAKRLVSILAGADGPARDMVLLNAGAAVAAGGLCSDLKAGINLAAEAIASGAAMEKLRQLQVF